MENSDDYSLYREAIATNLKRYRKASGIKPAELATILNMSTRNYYRLEDTSQQTGLAFGAEKLPLLAALFGITTDELCGLSPPMSTVTSEEALLLQYYRVLAPQAKESVVELVKLIHVTRMPPSKVRKLANFIRND